MGHLVVVMLVVVVSVTGFFLWDGAVRPKLNLQPGGLGGRFHLVPPLRPARLG